MRCSTTPHQPRTGARRSLLALAMICLVVTPLVALTASSAGAAVPGVAPFKGSGLAWGVNTNGQLGDGSTVDRAAAVAVHLPKGTTITAVAAGFSHSLALTSTGSVLAWGYNSSGQLGNGTFADSATPVAVQLPKGTTITAIAAGGSHSLARTSTGAVLAWGSDSNGQLGVGGAVGGTPDSPIPVAVQLRPGTTVTAIAAGANHSLALTATSSVLAWGANFSGQLGDDTTTDSASPVDVNLPQATAITAIAGGGSHSVALASTGTVFTWGGNGYGQLGDGTNNTSPFPVAVARAGPPVTAVAAGFAHTLALTSNGAVLAWGSDFDSELGDGGTLNRSAPGTVPLPNGTTVTAIAAGGRHSLALTSKGAVLAWGATGPGVCSDCPPTITPVPTAVVLPPATTVTAIAAGDLHNVAVAATLDHLVLTPAASAIAIGGSQSYTARAADVYGNDLGDVTAATTFRVGGGTCTGATCAAGGGVHTVTGSLGAARGTARLTVVTAPPGLSTVASAPVGLTGTISDIANLSGGVNPAGTITFQAFGPDDSTCTTGAAFTSTVTVGGNGSYSSASFSPVAPGTYRFVASYGGDAGNAPRPGACNEPDESVVVSPATPTISTTASVPVPAGGTISDTATLSGAFRPTGTVTFKAYGPDDTTCVKTPAFSSTRSVSTAGLAVSGPFLPAAAGTYRFAATYGGDVNNAPASSACNAPRESVAVGPTTTTSTTAPPPAVTVPPAAGPAPTPPVTPGRPAVPVLVAVSTAGQPFGPAGAGLNVVGRDYPASCSTAYFFFDSTRIGSAPVDSSGRASVQGVSVPGDAGAGVHRVTSSCRASGHPVQQASVFKVIASAVHRSAFVTSIPQPGQISLTLKSVGFSAGIAAALLALVGFPSQVFNSTLQDNYEEVRGWFHLHRPLSEVVQDVNQRILFPVFLAIGGVLYALLTPEFGFNLTSLALALGLAIAVAVTTVGFAVPTFAYFGLRWKDRGQILVLPGTIAIGAAFVLVSRLLNLQPGYLYGLLAVFVFHHDVNKRIAGRLAAASALFVIALALVAWVVRVPLTGATTGPGVGFWTIVLESALCGAFVIGLESTLVGLLPLRSMDGAKIKEWSRVAWAVLFALALFTLIEVLFQPGTAYVGHTSQGGKIAVATLYLIFGIGTALFWAYFRFRGSRDRNPRGLETEWEYGVR